MSDEPDFEVYENLPTESVGGEPGSLPPGHDAPNLKTQDEEPPPEPPDLSGYECLHGWVVIWPQQSKRYKGKILIPSGVDPLKDRTKDEGTVIAAGNGCEHVQRGDHVLYWKHAGSLQNIEGREVRVVKETEIYLVKRDHGDEEEKVLQ